MHYMINVTLNGKHYFSTSPNSIGSQTEAARMFNHFKQVFKAEDGYDVSVFRCEEHMFPVMLPIV